MSSFPLFLALQLLCVSNPCLRLFSVPRPSHAREATSQSYFESNENKSASCCSHATTTANERLVQMYVLATETVKKPTRRKHQHLKLAARPLCVGRCAARRLPPNRRHNQEFKAHHF
ncbi:hypothetical protein C8J56DRAFT_322628 [Mycena floridula]|nr:hypothetical protein C8J56DRAFT_322628 [Mycena floridula]